MPRRALPDPAGLPPVITWDEALLAGFSPDQIRHRVRAGVWMRIMRGVYLRQVAVRLGGDRFEQERRLHAIRAIAAVKRIPGSVITSTSAAVIYGLPLVTGVPAQVSLAVPPGSWVGIRNGVRRRHSTLAPCEVSADPYPITTACRTWIDVARDQGLADALSAGDVALRERLTNPDELGEALARLGTMRGTRRIESALSHLSPQRESPLESWSWSFFLRWRLPLPSMQREIRDRRNRFVARVDFEWRDRRLIGEADGLGKYDSLESFAAEKEREERLRELGFTVERWRWRDLARTPDRVRARLARALAAN